MNLKAIYPNLGRQRSCGRQCFQSCLSICSGEGSTYTDPAWPPHHTGIPHHTGSLLWPSPTPRHVQTCSHLVLLYRVLPPSPWDMFVHYVGHTIGRLVIGMTEMPSCFYSFLSRVNYPIESTNNIFLETSLSPFCNSLSFNVNHSLRSVHT